MQIRTGSIDFSAPLRGSGPRVASQTVVFPRSVVSALAGLGGYTIAYSGDDHHVGRMEVRLDATVNANTVTVEARLGLRDWSGNWDDDYNGTIEFTLLADLESVTATPPRPDLTITDMEFNQAVQFFRAASYLDPAHVQPDNSIWLVARKNTGIRVYTDWDPDAGLPPISQLTGSLTVQTSSTTLTLNPINPGGAITPVRDAQINMAIANHTLNFMIPAAWCVGTVTVAAELWDASSPASKSARYTRTIIFTPVEPLNLYLVGINYQAVTPNIPAPTQLAISGTIVSLIQTYPVGDVIQTGYATLDFSESVTANLANGCGSGLNNLLDRLNDLRGSSGDIYLGSLPAGILNTPGNSVGGCAPQGGKTAATFVDYSVAPIGDVPHEVGHALDRHHAPCASGCSVSPADPDSNYPQYGSFRSDSIGVFGFDPTSNTVFPPSGFSDFMAYFFPQWVSAYTYNGLRGSSFQPTGGGPSPGSSPHFREDVDFDVIFLRLTITRDRKVIRDASFNFAAKLLNRKRCGQFTVEMQGQKREALGCSVLHCNCDEGCTCWPKRIRDVVPFPNGSRWLVVWEGDTKIYEEKIPPEPKVKIDSAEPKKEGVLLTWRAEHDGRLWYLVHWYDDRAGVWRGVAPRQQSKSLLVPRKLFGESNELRVRVLATPGLGTGVAEHIVKLRDYTPQRRRVLLLGIDASKDKPFRMPNVLYAVVVDSAGRQLPDDGMIWYGNGEVIGRGTKVDLRSLGLGRHYLRLVMRGDLRANARTWIVERTREGFYLHQETCDPTPKRPKPVHKHPHPLPHDRSND
jgi:hypothetical protein